MGRIPLSINVYRFAGEQLSCLEASLTVSRRRSRLDRFSERIFVKCTASLRFKVYVYGTGEFVYRLCLTLTQLGEPSRLCRTGSSSLLPGGEDAEIYGVPF